ncbi:DEAD/DEAH box helicase [Aquibacillus sediminis]|uniref:DEAD/DEAH box helicase n=1 Tax=Aquibacillus sediminis TaxID=2574734 RepID=UPI0011093E03|nr:DEAD/DEAH box helicase [Aquibacillus sediminis]
MRSFFLDKQDIVRNTGERFYKRGYDYFKKGRVYGLSYNPSINSWRGHVRGAETYNVRIFFFENDDLEASCDCPAYETHYTCKHIAAVLLEIGQHSWKQLDQEQQDYDPMIEHPSTVPNDLFSTKMIEAFTTDQPVKTSKREIVNMEYIIGIRINPHNSKSFLEMEVKLGVEKPYVIKNIRELLVHIKKQKDYKITPTFTYQPEHHVFTEEDQHILADLIQAYENETIFENSFSNPLHEKRSIVIPPGLADKLLTKLSNQECYYKDYDGGLSLGIRFNEEIDPFNFKLDTFDEQTFTIDVSELATYTYLESYGYLFDSGNFYRLTPEQQAVMEQLYTVLPYRTEQSHPIVGDKINAFINKVVPMLEKVGNVQYTKNSKKKITITNVKPKIYLDENNNSLTAEVEFHYGDKVVKPYQDLPLDAEAIKRDTTKELELIKQIEYAGFYYLNQKFQLFKYELIFSFLHDVLPVLHQQADIYISEQVQAMMAQSEIDLSSSIDLQENSGMLDIRFDMEGITDSEVQHVLEALMEKKRYYRIPNGALLSLEGEGFDSFRELAQNLQLKKNQLQDGQLQVSAARSFQVEDALQPSYFQYSEAFENLLTQLKHPTELNFPLPKQLEAELRDYQHTGFQWMKTLSHYHLGGILADDMGLGKTVQTISYLLSEKEASSQAYRALIVAPASLVYNWKKEFEKFAPTMTTKVVSGSKQQRRRAMTADESVDIYITSYPLLRKDIDLYEHTYFDALILDEAQAIKNHLTLTAKAARSIQAGNRFALSGTPIENSLEELWSIFQTISPGLFGNKQTFLSFDPNYIAKITRPFILRRIKKDVLHELPDKLETVQYSELTKNQKEVYLAYVERMQQQLDQTVQEKGFEKGKLEILAGLTRLRQVCCHPSLFLDNYTGQSGKLEQLRELVDELQANGKRALIFSQFSSMLSMINTTLQQENIDTFYLDGSTPAQERMDMVDQFNEGEKSIFLISLKAGGTGLNLTGADTVILFDLWWNPAIEEQAAGRAHRIGQKKVVQVIRMITEGTIEEKIYELQQKKRELVDQIIQPGETMLSKLSEQEIRELLEMKG